MVQFESLGRPTVCFLFTFCSNYGRIFSSFGTIHERDGRQTDTSRWHRTYLCMTSRSKNRAWKLYWHKRSSTVNLSSTFSACSANPTRNSALNEIDDRYHLNHAIVVQAVVCGMMCLQATEHNSDDVIVTHALLINVISTDLEWPWRTCKFFSS